MISHSYFSIVEKMQFVSNYININCNLIKKCLTKQFPSYFRKQLSHLIIGKFVVSIYFILYPIKLLS